MGKNKATLETEIRNEILKVISEALSKYFETDVMPIDNSKLVMPTVDSEGNEKYAKINVSIARGQRDGKGGYIPYDGYAEAKAYQTEKELNEQEKERLFAHIKEHKDKLNQLTEMESYLILIALHFLYFKLATLVFFLLIRIILTIKNIL